MSKEIPPTTIDAATEQDKGRCAQAPRSEKAPYQVTQDLLADATVAVQALCKHLEHVPDKPRWYAANRALMNLWEAQ